MQGKKPEMIQSMASRPIQRILLEEKPEIGRAVFYVISAVMLVEDLLIFLIIVSLDLPWLVTSIVFAVNVLVFGSILTFIRFRRVCLTDRRVMVQFGVFKSSVTLSSIRLVARQNPPRWQMKSGLVSAFRGRLVYCFNNTSPFVMVERTSGMSKALFFNVISAEAFIRKLKEAKRTMFSAAP
jgi:hypothetical protein